MEHLAGQYFLNTDLREEEIREQIGELCRAGYEVIFLHARAGLKTPYLSQDWFDALDAAADELIRHGVKFAIWDEDNYPSGDAGNRICNAFPELASSQLNFRVIEAKKDVPVLEYFSVDGAFAGCYAVTGNGEVTDISGHCGTLRSKWNPARIQTTAYSPYAQLPLPHRRRSMDTPRFALAWTPDRDCRIVCAEQIYNGPGRHSSDLLAPETTRVLLDLVHARYERHFGGRMRHCAASFMDEPSPAGVYPWTRRLPEEFRRDHGYDLLPLLPHLALDVDAGSVKVRNDYRRTLRRLLCRNYLEPVRKWLNARNIASTGHLTRSEYLSWSGLFWPDELRCFRHFDIPCCDPLGAGVGRPGSMAHHIGIKTVTSAARLFGKRASGADAFAVGGDAVSLRDLEFMLNYHLVMGVTWFNIHGLYYTLDGERRDEAPPSLFYQHSQWPHMKSFLDHLKRRCEELSGEHVCGLEMLYPSSALQSRLPGEPPFDEKLHRTAEELLSHQRDFELIDEETLLEQDPAAFAVLRPYFVLAHTPVIGRTTADWLERYAARGGKVFIIGVTPEIIPELSAKTREKWRFAAPCSAAACIERIPGLPLDGRGCGNILSRRIRKAGRERLFLFNRGPETFRGTLDGSPLEIAPGEAGFADELRPKEKIPALTVSEWDLAFGLNCVPLNLWRTPEGTRIDLLKKTSFDMENFPAGKFSAEFTVEDSLEPVFFTTEESALARGSFEINGAALTGYEKARFRDCRERECNISALLKKGVNTVTFSGALFENAPYLRGRFKTAFPPDRDGVVLSPAPETFRVGGTGDYASLGYGTFSGMARYTGRLHAPETGRYALEFDFSDESVRIVIDGRETGTRLAPPYRTEVELAAGDHSLVLEVCNAPGPRDVMSPR